MLILASNSPRRKQLITLAGWQFQVFPVNVDEKVLPEETPRDYVLRLAHEKAAGVAAQVSGDSLVVAADTSVIDGDDILGKPADSAGAVEMLHRLRGRVHQVYSGLAVMRIADNSLLTDMCVTHVRMRCYSDLEILAYVASGDPMDKAGAYAIQHTAFQPVESLEGCYPNVVGLPICHLTRLLEQLDLPPPPDAPGACRDTAHYRCTISHLISGK
jgi:septum formation protein